MSEASKKIFPKKDVGFLHLARNINACTFTYNGLQERERGRDGEKLERMLTLPRQ